MLLQISKGLLVNQLVPLHHKILILQYKFKQNNMFDIRCGGRWSKVVKTYWTTQGTEWLSALLKWLPAIITYVTFQIVWELLTTHYGEKKNYNVTPWPKKICLSYDGKWLYWNRLKYFIILFPEVALMRQYFSLMIYLMINDIIND